MAVEDSSMLPLLLCFAEAEVSSSPQKPKAVLGDQMTVGGSGEFVCCVTPTPNPAKGHRQILTA